MTTTEGDAPTTLENLMARSRAAKHDFDAAHAAGMAALQAGDQAALSHAIAAELAAINVHAEALARTAELVAREGLATHDPTH
jgi:hypothetical protein